MGNEFKLLADGARKLSAEERLRLVDVILDSLEAPDSTTATAWSREIEDRWQACLSGQMPTRSVEQVLGKHLKP